MIHSFINIETVVTQSLINGNNFDKKVNKNKRYFCEIKYSLYRY